jgi:hypothetical protein
MNSLHAAFEVLVVDVPEYGDVDRAIEQAEAERRRRHGILAGLAAAAAVLIVIVGILALTQGKDAAPPPVAPTPTPTPTPSTNFESPGPRAQPVAMADIDGTLLLATIDQLDHPGTATLWRKHPGGWQRLGSLEDVVPLHLETDSQGSHLRPGPGTQDVYLTTSLFNGIAFSRDGGATWSRLPAPATCGGPCYFGLYGDYFYALGESYAHATKLSRAAFGTTTWEDRSLPPSAGPERGYTNLLVMADGTVVVEESGGCVAGATGHYRVSPDGGDTWSNRRALPGSSNCLTGTHDDVLYAHCNTTSCYYDTGGNGGGGGVYRTTDLVHWQPTRKPVPRGQLYGNPTFPPTARGCPPSLGEDPVYNWVEEPPLRVAHEVFKLFHVRNTQGHEHVLMVSRDDCRTWRPAYRQSSGS